MGIPLGGWLFKKVIGKWLQLITIYQLPTHTLSTVDYFCKPRPRVAFYLGNMALMLSR